MKRLLGQALVVGLLASVLAAPAATAGKPGVEARLAASLRDPSLSLARTAALAVDLRTGAVVYSLNASMPVVPASNAKLPVSWAALLRLGPGFRFRTEVVGVGDRRGRAWEGNVVVKGYGDPTLTTADLDAMARTLRARGIRVITGRVLGDESYYDTVRGAPGWKRSFLGIESPPLSALVVDRGRGWPGHSPPLLTAQAFTEALARHGVVVRGRPGLGTAPVEGFRLAVDTSATLADVVSSMNHESDNFTAEMLLKQLGAVAVGLGTTAGGARAVLAEMRAAGIPTAGVRIADGSGLSRLDRLTAEALVGILRAALASPEIRDVFVRSLAVSARSGTLSNRLWPLQGVVRGKTGTTNLSCSLSGLVRGTVAFAVLQNGNPVASWAARAAQDRFVTVLARRVAVG